MPGPLRNVVLAAVIATVIGGCGGADATIPDGRAEALLGHLQAVESNVEVGDCEGALDQAEAFSSEVEALPGEVDDEVQRALADAAGNLVNLASSDCAPEAGATGPAGADPATDLEVEPTTTVTTTEETTSEEATEEPQDEPDDSQADGPGGGQSGGNQGQEGANAGPDGGVSPSSGGVSGGGGGE